MLLSQRSYNNLTKKQKQIKKDQVMSQKPGSNNSI